MTSETMKACRLHKIGDFRTDIVPVPVPTGKQLLLKVESCGICGSDIPRIFELGTSKQKYPLTIGHEFGGTIAAVGEEADPSLVGKRGAIFPCIPCRKCGPCLSGDYAMCEDYDYLGSRSDGGFAEYCLIPSDWHFVPTHNPATSGEALAMTEPCTVAQHAIRRGEVCAGKSVLIFGAGPIGIMAARWAKIFGAGPVVLAEVVEEKVAFARAHGVTVVNSMQEDINKAFRALNNGQGADVVIEGTGTGAALGQCIECARTFGTVVMMGNPHKDTTIKLAQHSQILRKELTLKGIWNSHYAATPINEWHYTVQMMDEGRMQVTDLVTHRSGLDGLPQLCDDIYTRRISICKALYSPVEK
jgi:L-iditol 2-dehydrogenase